MTEHLEDCDGNGSVPCWSCGGVGGFHDCGEDCCMCLDADDVTDDCGGSGFIVCPACADGQEELPFP